MSNTLELEQGLYQPPENLEDFGERDVEGSVHTRLILYIGEIAVLDIVHTDENDRPDLLIKRIEDTPDNAMDLMRHPSLYLPPEEARLYFDSPRAA